jgi:hypothetical protein
VNLSENARVLLCKGIADVLNTNKMLTSLRIADCALGDAACKPLFASLKKSKTLLYLDLSGNAMPATTETY